MAKRGGKRRDPNREKHWRRTIRDQQRSGLAVAIGSLDRPAGALLAHAHALRAYSEDEGRFLEAVAHIIALALERKQIEEAHLGQSRVLQSVFDTLGAGVIVADREGRIVLHNRVSELPLSNISRRRRQDVVRSNQNL